MTRARSQGTGSTVMFATLFGCAAAIALAANWAFQTSTHISPEDGPDARVVIAAIDAATPRNPLPFPSRIMTVSLNDELFPEPIPEATSPPPAPPKLEIDLIAISSANGIRSIFALDRAANEYFSASAGDQIPSGPVVLVIEQDTVIFTVAGVEVRRELAP